MTFKTFRFQDLVNDSRPWICPFGSSRPVRKVNDVIRKLRFKNRVDFFPDSIGKSRIDVVFCTLHAHLKWKGNRCSCCYNDDCEKTIFRCLKWFILTFWSLRSHQFANICIIKKDPVWTNSETSLVTASSFLLSGVEAELFRKNCSHGVLYDSAKFRTWFRYYGEIVPR